MYINIYNRCWHTCASSAHAGHQRHGPTAACAFPAPGHRPAPSQKAPHHRLKADGSPTCVSLGAQKATETEEVYTHIAYAYTYLYVYMEGHIYSIVNDIVWYMVYGLWHIDIGIL